jgi:hypothetical protein
VESTVDRCVVCVERVHDHDAKTPVSAEAISRRSPRAVLKFIESKYGRIPSCFRDCFVCHRLSVREIDRGESCIVRNLIDVVHSLIESDNVLYIVCLEKNEARNDIEFVAPGVEESV